MDEVIYQKKKPAPAAKAPAIKLKQRLKAPEIAQKIADYVNKLPPVGFSLYDNNPANPYSLPQTVPSVFVKENLLDEYGQVIIANKPKLNDPEFVRQLTNKLTFCLTQGYIQNNIYQALTTILTNSGLFSFNLEDTWEGLADFLSEHYSSQATVIFMSEYYPDRLLKIRTISRLPLLKVNQEIKKGMVKQLHDDKEKLTQTIEFFLGPVEWLKSDQKKKVISRVSQICMESVPNSCTLNMTFDLELDVNQFPYFKVKFRPI